MKKFFPKREKTETKMKTWAEESADTADEEKRTERDTVTTKKKQNVCFDRYVPVQGSIGDEDTEYKLEIAMVSDAMQPDDILHNYTGILKIK